MKKILRIILVTCSLQLTARSFSQDIHFSQFFQAALLRNPALAGIYTGDVRVQAVYRNQWNSVTDPYKTASLEVEYKMPVGRLNDYLTVGMQMLYDKAGTIGWTSTHLLPALNYHKSLSGEKNRYLSLGFMGGMVQQWFDRSKMTTNNQYDNGFDGETIPANQYHYVDGSVGLSFNSNLNENPDNNFFLGAAYHHFNKPKISFYDDPNIRLSPKWAFSAGIRFGVSEISYLTFQADHSMQGLYRETVAGVMYGFKIGPDADQPDYTIHGGAFLRWNDAVIPAIRIGYSPFSLTFSYDVNISKLKPSSYGRGGFELSVSYLGFRKNNSTIEALRCPRF